MAIKGADLLHVGNKVLIERAQTAGPAQVNLSPEKVYELGNYQGIGTIFDIPDLSFSVDSYDVSTAFEALLNNSVPLSAPVQASATTTTADSATFAATGTYYYKVVATDSAGNATSASNEESANVAATTTSVSLSWGAVAGAAGYKVYRGTAAGAENKLLTTIGSGATVSYKDTGTAGTTATVPSINETGPAAGTLFKLDSALPLDVLSQFKGGLTESDPYATEGSVIIPYLILESASYKFGLTSDAEQTFGLRGDAIFYSPGSGFQEIFVGTNTANQTINPAHPAFPYNGDLINGTKYMLGVRLKSGKRLQFGTDYTEAAVDDGLSDGGSTITLTIIEAVPTSDYVEIVYSSPVVAEYAQTVHTVPNVTKPAAIRGRDIEVFVGGTELSDRWTSVQSVEIDWKVDLDRNEEFGNYQLIDSDFFVPDVSGSIVVRPRHVPELLTKVQQSQGIESATEVGGAQNPINIDVVIKLHSPYDGSILKCLEIPDCQILPPSYSAKVQTKVDVTFQLESATGVLNIYHGDMP